MTMDHHLVSELLADLVHGRLTPEVEGEVRVHLESCPECRLELGAVRALVDAPAAALAASERVALRDAARSAVAPKPSRWRRLAPALGAAGLIAIVAVGAATVLTGEERDTQAGGAGVERPAGADKGGVVHEAEEGTNFGAAADAAEGGAGKAVAKGRTQATTSAAGASTQALAAVPPSLAAIGPLGPQLLVEDRDLYDSSGPRPAARRLLNLVPTRGWADQAIECTQVARSLLPAGASLAYAAAFPSERVLVLGFVWDQSGGRRFVFWGWPEGDCSTVTPIHARGAI